MESGSGASKMYVPDLSVTPGNETGRLKVTYIVCCACEEAPVATVVTVPRMAIADARNSDLRENIYSSPFEATEPYCPFYLT